MGFVPLNYRAGIRACVGVFVLVVFTVTLTDTITVHAPRYRISSSSRESR
jgi:hypothetical protein